MDTIREMYRGRDIMEYVLDALRGQTWNLKTAISVDLNEIRWFDRKTKISLVLPVELIMTPVFVWTSVNVMSNSLLTLHSTSPTFTSSPSQLTFACVFIPSFQVAKATADIR